MSDTNVQLSKNDPRNANFCQYCDGIFEHQSWCAMREPRVLYAYRLLADASTMTLADSLILHSLGVAWVEDSHDLVGGSAATER
jgi:hypothetical protein